MWEILDEEAVLDQEEVLDQVGPSELNYSQDLQQCHHIYLDDVSNALGNVIVPNNFFICVLLRGSYDFYLGGPEIHSDYQNWVL